MRGFKWFIRTIFCVATATTSALLTGSCGEKYRFDEGMVWHTTYHITYKSDKELSDSVLAVLREVGASLNVFDPASLASRVNVADSVAINEDYRTVYEMSRRINKETDGAFDPTLGPLITAWGFGKGHKATSDTLRLDSLLAITGIERTHISGDMIIKGDRRIEFNFSAIAKGYGCDRVAAMLERNGVKDYLVEIGGEIRCAGISPSGGDWKISIDRPVTTDRINHTSQCVVAFSGKGMATSGNYRNFHESGGERYGHTISSRTGRPVRTDVLSATVIAPTAMEADALATSMMALGSEKAMSLASKRCLPAMLILADSTVLVTPQFNAAKVEAP